MKAPPERAALVQRAAELGAELTAALVDQLLAYAALVARWNRTTNLVSFKGPIEAIDRLLLEPMIAARFLPAGVQRVIDIGSGAGSPALPMNLVRPDCSFRLVEARQRKAVFLRVAARDLGLSQVAVETRWAEDLARDPSLCGSHDVLTLRAVKLTRAFLKRLTPLVRPGGQWMFFGRRDGSLPLPNGLRLIAAEPLIQSSGSVLYLVRS